MTLRHAAALALAGWYLLYPPFNAEKQVIDPTLPLTRWYNVKTFDSLAACEAQKIPTLEALDRVFPGSPSSSEAAKPMRQMAQCVSADDPRLKSN